MSQFGASKIVLIIIVIISFVIMSTQRWQGQDGKAWENVISSDGHGYYAYLPAIFIDQNMGDQRDSLANAMLAAGSLMIRGENTLIKFFAGTALLQVPFFAIGHQWAKMSDHRIDGYSKPYQIMVGMAGLLYLLLGFWCVYLLLRSFDLSDKVSAFTILLLFFGTNLLYYALMQPSMSHVYSFALISALFLCIRRVALTKSRKYLILVGLIYGLVVLIRPVNGLSVLAIPFLMPSGSWVEWMQLKKSMKTRALLAGLLMVLVLVIQPILWNIQIGEMFTWPYSGEGFYWGSPKLKSFMFSFRKGLFIYTPVLLFGLFGLYQLFRKDAKRAIHVLVYLLVLIYVSSSWWNWYYGDSFGQRPIIDHYAAFAIIIARGLQHMNKTWLKVSTALVCVALTALNLVQSWQYEHGIMDRFNMNSAKYGYIFMKTGKAYENILGGYNDAKPFCKEFPGPVVRVTTNMDSVDPHFTGGKMTEIPEGASAGKMVNELNANVEFSTSFSISAREDLMNGSLYLVVDLKRLQRAPLASDQALGIVSISSPREKNWHYTSFKMNDIPPGDTETWEQLQYSFDLPAFRTKKDELKFYIWNKGEQEFYIDDMNALLYVIE